MKKRAFQQGQRMGLRGRSKTLVLKDVKNGWKGKIILRPSSDLLPARWVSFAKRMTWFLGCWHTWCLFFLTEQSSSTGWGAVIFVWFNHDMHNSQGLLTGPSSEASRECSFVIVAGGPLPIQLHTTAVLTPLFHPLCLLCYVIPG